MTNEFAVRVARSQAWYEYLSEQIRISANATWVMLGMPDMQGRVDLRVMAIRRNWCGPA